LVLSALTLDVFAQTTAPQYALTTLLNTRTQVKNNLPAYVTLQKRLEVLIEATQAALDPKCKK
jgi:hypothetical protein